MLIFRPFTSGSKGNLYIVSNGQTKILLECGLPIKEIQKHLDYKVSELDGVLVTHEHLDHARSTKDLARLGINCYMTEGTQEALGVAGHRIQTVIPQQQFTLGTFEILPFQVQHDAACPVGYLVYSKTTGDKLLFATDTFYIKFCFKKLTIIAIECNYAKDILQANVRAGLVPAVLEKRLLTSHFSLENVKEFLKANDLSRVREIWLLHLSDQNSDAERFKREVQELTGKPVFVAG